MINEIASLVPMCQNVTHRLDKLSILELAVQHMRMVTSEFCFSFPVVLEKCHVELIFDSILDFHSFLYFLMYE